MSVPQKEDAHPVIALGQIRRQHDIGAKERVFDQLHVAFGDPVAILCQPDPLQRVDEIGRVFGLGADANGTNGVGDGDSIAQVVGFRQDTVQRPGCGNGIKAGGRVNLDR